MTSSGSTPNSFPGAQQTPTAEDMHIEHSQASTSGENQDRLSNDDDDSNDDDASHTDGEDGLTPKRVVQPLTPEALAAFNAAQERAGIIYISRIPPGMRPTKIRHLMSAYGEVGRVYLQQEDPKRAYLRRKHTSTKKAHFTEGWVEFRDKRVARSVAEMLNAQPVGGKKGTRWRDDVWTMKYLPRFKWNMLTEQVANEAAIHTARLRVELSQSRAEQRDYLRQVELARVLDKRAERKRKAGRDIPEPPPKVRATEKAKAERDKGKARAVSEEYTSGRATKINDVLKSIF